MAILPSGLETIAYGSQGWNAIVTANMQILNNKLVNLMTSNKIAGTDTIAASAVTINDPATQTSETLTDSTTGTASNTIGDVGASFDQTTLNNINASLVDEINKLRADILEIRTREVEYKTAITDIQTKLNTVLTSLRKTTGCGVLGG